MVVVKFDTAKAKGKGQTMSYSITKIEGTWTVIGVREDGTRFDYRFSSKREAQKWAKAYLMPADE